MRWLRRLKAYSSGIPNLLVESGTRRPGTRYTRNGFRTTGRGAPRPTIHPRPSAMRENSLRSGLPKMRYVGQPDTLHEPDKKRSTPHGKGCGRFLPQLSLNAFPPLPYSVGSRGLPSGLTPLLSDSMVSPRALGPQGGNCMCPSQGLRGCQ